MGLLLFVVAAIAVGVAVGLMSDLGLRASTSNTPTLPTWPEFTMTYEADGDVIGVGDKPAVVTREVRLLEYSTKTDWTDTVLEAPTFITKGGPFNTVGTFRKVSGNTYIDSDGVGASQYETTIEEGETTVPGRAMAPFPLEESGVETSRVTTTATVCFLDQCTDNAEGLLYRRPNGSEVVFVNDARGIPLRAGNPTGGNSFIVSEILINDTRQEFENPR